MERPPEFAAPTDRVWVRPTVLVPTFALIAAVAGALPSFSLSANLLVLGIGGSMFWLGMSNTLPRYESSSRLPPAAHWWVAPVGILVVTEAVTFLLGARPEHPTLSLLADPVLERYLPRSAMFLGWMAGFWGLVRR
jgi:hypothetical protein